MNAQTFARLHPAQVRSGISIAAFCRTRGLALSSYPYWRRRYRSTSAADGFIEVRLRDPSQSAQTQHAPLPTPPAVMETPIGLFYRGAHLSLPAGFSSSALRQCLEILKEVLPC